MTTRSGRQIIFQESEILVLIVAAFSVPMAMSIFRHPTRPMLPGAMFLGYACLIAAHFFTVVEGVVFHGLFNALEHVSYLLGGFFFATGCHSLARGDWEGKEQ